MLYFLEKKKKYVLENYPQHKKEIIRLEVITNLNLLQLICATNSRKYSNIKKQCCSVIKKHPLINTTTFLKYQKVLFFVVNFRILWFYQLLISNFKNK